MCYYLVRVVRAKPGVQLPGASDAVASLLHEMRAEL